MKWFKRWDVKALLELSSDAIKYRLLEAIRTKWEDAKTSKLEY